MATAKTENEISTSRGTIVLEDDMYPFKDLNISENWKHLDSIKERTVCGSCNKSRKYFCYTCYVPVPEIQHLVPNIKVWYITSR